MGERWGIGAQDVVFMPSPVTHITGAFWTFDMPWVQGCASVLLDVWSTAGALNAIRESHCTVSGGATPFLQQLLDANADSPGAMDTLRLFFCGGTTVSPDLIRRAQHTLPHCLFFRAYGSTEMPTTTLGISSREQNELGAITDGEVVPLTQSRIVDTTNGREVPDGQAGEILVRGPSSSSVICTQKTMTGSMTTRFFHMGDLGRPESSERSLKLQGGLRTLSSGWAKILVPRKSRTSFPCIPQSPTLPLSPCRTRRRVRLDVHL